MNIVMGPDNEKEARLTAWITQYQGMLLKTCYLYLHDRAAAEDAVQETFIKAYRAMERFRGQCSESTWLTQIAINVCRDTLRGAWFRHVDRSITPEELPEGGSPEHPESNAITAAVMNLPSALREVVILYYYHNMNTTEIADVLRVSQPAVSSRLKRARNRLRDLLRKGELE